MTATTTPVRSAASTSPDMTRAAIGVDIGGSAAKGGVVDPTGNILHRIELPTDPSAATKTVIAVVEELLEWARAEGIQPVGAGIGAAGFIDADSGTVVQSPNLTYEDPHVAAAVRSRVEIDVVVDNDANAAAWGEHCFGTARGVDHLALVTLGTGVGSGFVVAGHLVRGKHGAAAELGHMVVDPSGPRCPCGLRGCLEQFASGTAIANRAKEALIEAPESSIGDLAETPGEVTARDVARAAKEYDETARAVLRRAGRMLGIGLANVVNLFDPEVIVLAGSVVGAGESYLGPARDQLNQMMTAQRRHPVRLDVSALGKDAGLLGAAALVLEADR
jgi:glucokinase